MVAGLVAVADQGRALSGLPTLTSAQTLADVYAAPASNFHDVTTGSNGYSAGVGYDLVTGRGTPIASQFIPTLVGTTNVAPTPVPSIGAFTASPASVTPGATVTLTASNVADTSGTISSVNFYRESNGTSGLQTGSDTLVGAGTQSGSTWTLNSSTANFAAGNYTYYAVATDNTGHVTAPSTATLTVTAPVVSNGPANDNFASATNLVGTAGSIASTTINATKESGEPYIAGNYGGKSIWYTWTATSTHRVNLTTHGSSFDTLLAVDTGTALNRLTTVASNDDDLANGTRTSSVTFSAIAGTTYHFVIDGYNGASGTVQLNMNNG